ncbi:MAG: hypothetical protein WAW06_05130 [bacterium]
MRTSEDRSEQYQAKYDAPTVGLKLGAQLLTMKAEYQPAVEDLYLVETAIQTILNAVGCAPTQRPFYYNFGREIWKRQWGGMDGPALKEFALVMHTKYVSYGLGNLILIQIAFDVFGITIP